MPTSTHEEKEAPTDEDETSQCRDASQTWDDMCAAYEQHVRDNGNAHVAVPVNNPKLYNWVKNQRSHYQDYLQGKPTKLTIERVAKLNDIGFVWQINMTWDYRFLELQHHYSTNGSAMVSRRNSSTKKLGEWLKKQTSLLLNAPRTRHHLEKVIKLLSVRLLFPNNELWKKVIQMLSTKVAGGDEASAALENEFFAEMLNYLQMLFKEYQEGATPCISREQAEQLQRLLGIPRTSMDIKRRKKNSVDGGTEQFTPLTPTLPSLNDFVALHHVLSSTSQALPFDTNDDTVAQVHSSDVAISSDGAICVHAAATSSSETLADKTNISSHVLLPQQLRPDYEVLLSPHVEFGIGLRF